MENIIEVKNIVKTFKVFKDKSNLLKDRFVLKARRKYDCRQVLNGISFNLQKGTVLGLIGENGCGKSTLLKLLTRIMYPDSGEIKINGKVSSLIELGAGFHPDMSGRENIYTNASIFGLTKKEIDEVLDDIIEFSELKEFIDEPVRTYSSGMYMRLAFSVAINVKADILLIDEILAVGDLKFQNKCFKRLIDLKNSGITIVIVSHALEQIKKICDRCIWINRGVIQEDGLPSLVCDAYEKYMYNISDFAEINGSYIKSIDLNSTVYNTIDDIEISFNFKRDFTNGEILTFNIINSSGLVCYVSAKNDITDRKLKLVLEYIRLVGGSYTINFSVVKGDVVLDSVSKAFIISNPVKEGVITLNQIWSSDKS